MVGWWGAGRGVVVQGGGGIDYVYVLLYPNTSQSIASPVSQARGWASVYLHYRGIRLCTVESMHMQVGSFFSGQAHAMYVMTVHI